MCRKCGRHGAIREVTITPADGLGQLDLTYEHLDGRAEPDLVNVMTGTMCLWCFNFERR